MNNGFVDSINLDLADNTSQETVKNNIQCYEVMHGERQVAQINIRGEAEILDEVFFPYDLYLEADKDFDTLINNMNNFYHWCASRMLSLDRKYAKRY